MFAEIYVENLVFNQPAVWPQVALILFIIFGCVIVVVCICKTIITIRETERLQNAVEEQQKNFGKLERGKTYRRRR